MQNIFTAGQDSMLDFLAKRDLEQQKQRDFEIGRQDKERNFENTERQISNQEATLKFNQDRALKADTDKVTERNAKDERVNKLIKVVVDGNATPEVRQQAGLELDSLGVSASAIGGVLNPKPDKPTTQPVMRINPRTGKMENLGDAPANAHFVQEPAPPREHVDRAPKDNPNLPQGVVNYLDTFLTKDKGGKPYTLDEAYQEVSGSWGQLKAAHPHLDAGQVKKYLLQAFPQDQMTGERHGFVVGGAQPAAPGAPPAAPAAAPAAPASAPADAAAIAFLNQNKAPVTPANIAAVKARMGQ